MTAARFGEAKRGREGSVRRSTAEPANLDMVFGVLFLQALCGIAIQGAGSNGLAFGFDTCYFSHRPPSRATSGVSAGADGRTTRTTHTVAERTPIWPPQR